MGIDKKDYYQGAALFHLITTPSFQSLVYESPFFVLNKTRLVHLKYSAKTHSPWRFTFNSDEQNMLLKEYHKQVRLYLGMICGADGVACLNISSAVELAFGSSDVAWIACFRKHGEHYEIRGSNGVLDGKVAPSDWLRILEG